MAKIADMNFQRETGNVQLLVVPKVIVKFFGRNRLVDFGNQYQQQFKFSRRQIDNFIVDYQLLAVRKNRHDTSNMNAAVLQHRQRQIIFL